MKDLEILDLSGNTLKDLHGEEFEPLIKLSMLDLSNNDIAHPPHQLGFLPQLERLNLQGNPTRRSVRPSCWGPQESSRSILGTELRTVDMFSFLYCLLHSKIEYNLTFYCHCL